MELINVSVVVFMSLIAATLVSYLTVLLFDVISEEFIPVLIIVQLPYMLYLGYISINK